MSMLFAALLTAQTVMPPIGQRPAQPERLIAGANLMPDAAEDPAIAAAVAFPLGSAENPIRVGGPAGERAYLERLRCSNGTSPRLGARREAGVGAFGSLVGAYRLDWGGAATDLVMDMYHEEHVEDRAPPRLSILPR